MNSPRRPSHATAVVIVLLFAATGLVLAARAGILLSRPGRGQPSYLGVSVRAPQHRAPASRPPLLPAQVYFLRVVDGRERMAAVTREVPSASPAEGALHELLAGQVPEGCARPLPAGVSLREVRTADGVATADFSKELVSSFRGGSDNEGVAVYAVVNTLASLPAVRTVRILVEGEAVDTLGGHLDISGPLVADDELVVPTN